MSITRRPAVWVLLLASALTSPAFAQVDAAKPATQKTKPAAKPVYDEAADAKAQIAAALVKAKKEHKRVLIQYGANWCGWCKLLHETFKTNREIKKQLLDEYEVVLVDMGHFDKNKDIASGYGAEIKGIPFLTVLDENQKVLVNQPSDSLEEGKAHSVEKVKAFLTQWQAPVVDAEQVLAAALEQAKKRDKLVFLHFGAPWCGWCHRLEDFLARPEIEAVMSLDFVDLKVDQDRMKNAKAVEARFGMPENSGIPWFVFLDADQKIKATSTMEKGGNTGYPSDPAEVAHFVKMLRGSVTRMKPEQIAFLEKELNADREQRDAQQKAAREKQKVDK